MALEPGTMLGPYEVLSLIGVGGMGEVYKGRDTRLDRIVALKVLAPHLMNHPEARQRFKREATTLANLRHEHICVLYDIGHENGTDFLVMEYLEGETLAERLKKGPLPLEQVWQYAIEISDALDKAHRQGFTHRDIKPANLMLVPQSGSGTKTSSKLLDFGLAKLKQEIANASVPPSERPTTPGTLTQHGTLLGTLQYMAPEQVEGKTDELDGRTDVFAFGAVVYEMATGKKAFDGKTQASVIAKILEVDPPPMSSLQPMTPPALDRVVKQCLAKDPDERWQTAADLWRELEWISGSGSQAGTAPEEKPAVKGWRRVLLRSVAPAFLAALAAGIAIWDLRTPEPRPVTSLAVTLPNNVALGGLDLPGVAISPDGSHLAYVGTRGGTSLLFLRALDSLEAKPMEGTEGAAMPFFSPDGQWLGFFAGASLKKISITGGAAVTLSNVIGAARGGSWGADDRIVFAGRATSSSLLQISASGGTSEVLTKLDPTKREVNHLWPQLLPGGKAVLFTVQPPGPAGNFDIAVQELETGERKVLVQGGTYGRYVPTGHLVYDRAGTLMAAPFDLKRLELAGPAVPVVESVKLFPRTGGAQFSISDRGSLVYVPGSTPGAQNTLVWVDRKGVEQPLAAPPRSYSAPRLSPDGRLLAVTAQGDIWVYDIPRGTLSRLTFDGISAYPLWGPDGKRIAFISAREGKPSNLFWKPSDGSGPDERLTTSEHTQFSYSWSPDGQVIAFTDVDPTTGNDIWVLPLSGNPRSAGPGPGQPVGTEGRKLRPFLQTPFFETGAQFSPDGRWLAYVSDESGRFEIYVQPFPVPGGPAGAAAGGKWQISTDGGTETVWAPNGELFYWSGNRLIAVETKTQPTFSAGTPRLLLEGPYERSGFTNPNYAITADGQRFVMVKASEQQQAPTQINVVLNWFEELKRRVPTK